MKGTKKQIEFAEQLITKRLKEVDDIIQSIITENENINKTDNKYAQNVVTLSELRAFSSYLMRLSSDREYAGEVINRLKYCDVFKISKQFNY